MEKTGLIYKATNKINGKVYVGQTTNIKKRIKDHQKRSKTHTSKFSQALREFGFENFQWDILENNIPIQNLDKEEHKFIIENNSLMNGYNSSGSTRRPPGSNGYERWFKLYGENQANRLQSFRKERYILEELKLIQELIKEGKSPFKSKETVQPYLTKDILKVLESIIENIETDYYKL